MGKIVDINSVSDDECSVTYDVLNGKKISLFKKDSKFLLDRINRYIEFLYQKDKILKSKSNDNIFHKRFLLIFCVIATTLIAVYFIMSFVLYKSYIIGLLGYIVSLMLIGIAFFAINGINCKCDLHIENRILQNENEILKVESIRDNCLEVINDKNKGVKKTKE